MEIRSWSIAEAQQLTQVYNEQTAKVPYCYPVLPDEFAKGVAEPIQDHHSGQLIVAQQKGAILGFAHIAVAEPKKDRGEAGGTIRFLTYKPGERAVGQGLLEAAEGYVGDKGLHYIDAFRNGYPFYRFNCGPLSDKQGHIRALFGINNYTVDFGWYFFERPVPDPDREPTCPDPDAVIEVELTEGELARPDFTLQLMKDKQQMGVCNVVSLGRYYRARAAHDTACIDWISVREEDRKKGLGRYLMQRAHWQLGALGYRTVALRTHHTNYRAQILYTNLGYRSRDLTYVFEKNIE